MTRNFTKLVCIGIACFCMVSVLGQDNNPFVRMFEENVFTEKDVQLRASNTIYSDCWLPDSMIRYNAVGVPIQKTYYNNNSSL